MANTLNPMDLKQILSLHLDGLSNRTIGTTLGISRNTINHYMRLFKASNYALKTLLSFDNENILKNNMDKHSLFYQSLEDNKSHIPKHDNIRGASTYK